MKKNSFHIFHKIYSQSPSMYRGISTLEIMIALAILCTTLTAVVLVTLGIPSAIVDGHEAEIGASFARALIQKEFLLGLSSFPAVTNIGTTTIAISNISYASSLSVNTLPDGITKEIQSFVSWQDSHGITRNSTLSGLITDLADISANPCSSVLSGNWQNPLVHSFSLSAGNLLPLNFSSKYPAQLVSVSSSTLAISITSAAVKTDPTVFIFSIASSTSPTYLGSIDNATSTKAGFASLALQGNFLYGANSNAANFSSCTQSAFCSQLQIFDISNPANASVLTNYKLATTSPPYASGTGDQSAGKSIFYANGLVYLGLQKTATLSGSTTGDEFNIINVQNPHAPLWLGGYSIGRTINQIIVSGDYAYLATDDPHAELTILNVHNPSHITLAGTYDAPGNTSFGFGEAISLIRSTLSLGRSYISGEPSFTLLNVSTTSLPSVIGAEQLTSTTTPQTVTNILLRNFILFVLTNTSLELWNVMNPFAPTKYAAISLPGTASSTSPSGMTCEHNIMYIASEDSMQNGYLTVVTGS
jgi:hypothetical protein